MDTGIQLPGIISVRGVQIKDDSMKVKLEQSLHNDNDKLTHKMDSGPHPDLLDALDGFKAHFQDVLQFSDQYMEDVEIIGISITEDDGVMKVEVTGEKSLATGLTTEFTAPATSLWREDAEKALVETTKEAKKAMQGKRSQFDLFNDEGRESPSEAEPA